SSMIDYRDHINVDADVSLTGQVKSTLSGMAPFLVASSLLVSNLNADLLDGYHASDFVGKSMSGAKSSNIGAVDANLVDTTSFVLAGAWSNAPASAGFMLSGVSASNGYQAQLFLSHAANDFALYRANDPAN